MKSLQVTATRSPNWKLRGAQTPDELNLMDYVALVKKFAKRYENALGWDEAYQEGFVALCKARDDWDPARGPFAGIVRWYLSYHLNGCVDARQKDSGVPIHERQLGKKTVKNQPRRAGWRPTPRYEVISGTVIGRDGNEVDILDLVADDSPNPEELHGEAQEVARVRAAIDGLNGSGGAVRSILDEDAEFRRVGQQVRALDRDTLSRLRTELADLRPDIELDVFGEPPKVKERKPKPEPKPRRLAAGKRPEPGRTGILRDGTVRAAILRLLAEGTHTAEAIAAKAGSKTVSNTVSHIYCLWRDTGVGYSMGENRAYHAIFPPGKRLEDFITAVQDKKKRAADEPPSATASPSP